MLLQSSDTNPANARVVSLVHLDHSYSKPWNWRPESSLCQPTKTLFVPRVSRAGAVETETEADDSDGLIDVVSEPSKPSPLYNVAKATKYMNECEKFTCFTRPSLASLNSEDEEEGDEIHNWEERLPRESWTQAQGKLFSKVMKVLIQDRLARLAGEGADNEPILRRLNVDKSCKRMRAVLASPPCTWDRLLVQWLHNTLSTYLPKPYLAAWLDILQSLKAKIPGLMERILAGAGGHHIDPQARTVAQEGLLLLLRRPWDPVEGCVTDRRLSRLPGHPIIIVAPPGLDNRDSKTISNRMKLWNNQLGCLGKVIVINMQPPRGESAVRTSVNFYLHQMVSATLNKVREIKNANSDRPIVVVGWGPGAAIAAHVASIERLSGLVCLGFPVSTLAGIRGQVGDTLLDLKTPGLFVVGERSSQCSTDDIEDIREKMGVETGLVIVGGADDQLRLTTRKKKAELVTQSMVDKSIIDQIKNFLSSVILKQAQQLLEKDVHHEGSFAVPMNENNPVKKMKARKRLNEHGGVNPSKKLKAGASTIPGQPAPVKKPRRPKKLKMPEGEHFTLSSGSITPLPASLLSISTPLPPSPIKDSDPPPLPIRIPMMTSTSTPNSPTPRVIHYAGAAKSDSNPPNTINWSHTGIRPAGGQLLNQAIRPTGGQLIAQAPAPRPAAGQLILSTIPRPGLSPTKIVTSGQLSAPVSPRSSPINVQLPSPGLIKHSPQVSPEKVVILMSPSKDGAASAGSSSSSLDQGHQGGLIMSPGRLIMSNAPGRILLQADKISELTDKKTSPNKSTTTTVSVQSPTKVLNTVPVTSSK